MNEFLVLMKSELILTVIIFILLFIEIGNREWTNESLLNFVNVLLLLNFITGFLWNKEGVMFSSMFKTNNLVALEKNMLNLGTLIISLQAYSWLKNHKYLLEFYILLLSTLLGMFIMVSGGSLLIFYLGLELSTIPLAVIANFNLDKPKSSEAGMKFIISSAFSSGLLLFGISLIYGTTGTIDFTQLPQFLNGSSLQVFAFILLLAGFAFKISVVPFHLWTADVYEGSPVAVTSYLSVISKGAVLFVFVSVLYTVFQPMETSWYNMLCLLSVLTMIIGNLFAIRQKNLKRFLAFSSIAQIGFILIGISAGSREGTTSVIYFILIYIFSNLGAFSVISIVSELTGKEDMEDYKGLYKTNQTLVWVLTISLFSLAGIPPTAGFFGKFFLIMAGAAKGNYILIVIAAVNMILSLYYYLKVVKTMFSNENPIPIEKLSIPSLSKLGMFFCLSGIICTGFISWIFDYIYSLS